MTRIAITGAGGTVGRAVVDGFGDEHEVVAFTHSEHTDLDSTLLDVTDPDDTAAKLDGFDVVIHLAGASSPDADWETVSETNVQGTKHVLDAAVSNGIDRVVFASSNHAVGTYTADGADPEAVAPGDHSPVPADAPASPDSFYGVSKAACESLVAFYANRHGLEAVILRIGWYMPASELRAVTGDDAAPGTRRFARAVWLSPRDCREIHRRAATADLSRTPITVNAVSRNDDRYFTLVEAMQSLGYSPRDNAAEILDS
jgi:L-arabinose 1-dehydrogenase [NAD(P)+]